MSSVRRESNRLPDTKTMKKLNSTAVCFPAKPNAHGVYLHSTRCDLKNSARSCFPKSRLSRPVPLLRDDTGAAPRRSAAARRTKATLTKRTSILNRSVRCVEAKPVGKRSLTSSGAGPFCPPGGRCPSRPCVVPRLAAH